MAESQVSKTVVRAAGSLWTISIVTIVVRVTVFLQLFPVQGTQGFYKYDEQARIAWAMVSGYGFSSPWVNTPLLPTAQQPPFYPWVLAAIFELAGPYSYASLWLIEFFNVLCAVLTAILILKVGKRMFGEAVGVIAALIWACLLDEAVVCLRVWDSSLSALLLMLGVCTVLRLKTQSTSIQWSLFGLIAAIAALTNTSLLAVFIGFWIWLFVADETRLSVKKTVLSVAVCVLVLLPWSVRNYAAFHRILPVRDNFGFELWQGNHAGSFDVIAEFNQLGEIGFMEGKRVAAVRFIVDDPIRFLGRCGKRFFNFWSSPNSWLWVPLSILSWLGGVFAVRSRGSSAVPLVIPVLLFPLVYYITHPGTYRHPIEPVMLLLAVFAVARVAGQNRGWNKVAT